MKVNVNGQLKEMYSVSIGSYNAMSDNNRYSGEKGIAIFYAEDGPNKGKFSKVHEDYFSENELTDFLNVFINTFKMVAVFMCRDKFICNSVSLRHLPENKLKDDDTFGPEESAILYKFPKEMFSSSCERYS